MAKKWFQKALSVGLSLTLCAGLVAPSFAATFRDLQDAISGRRDTSADKVLDESGEETGYYGYARHQDEETGAVTYGITAKNREDGTREVNLHEDVEFNQTTDGAFRSNGITINSGRKVELDLNGQTIDKNPGAELIVTERNYPNGNKDAIVGYYQNVQRDENGDVMKDPNGNVMGNRVTALAGRVLTIQNANVTIKDSTAETCTGEDGETHYVAGTGQGAIRGGDIYNTDNTNGGGAILVTGSGGNTSFVMQGVTVAENQARMLGGGVSLYSSNASRPLTAEFDGVTFSNNVSGTSAGALYAGGEYVDVTLTGCNVQENYVLRDCDALGLDMKKGTATIDGCTIRDNVAVHGTCAAIGINRTNAVVTNNTIVNNTGAADAAVVIGKLNQHGVGVTNVVVTGNTIKGNGATGNRLEGDQSSVVRGNPCYGLRVFTRAGATYEISNNTVCGNGAGVEDASEKQIVIGNAPATGAEHYDEFWTLDDAVKTQVDPTEEAEGSITYKCPNCGAEHVVPLYLLSFDGNGATGNVPENVIAAQGETFGDPEAVPTREGYTFTGWYDEEGNEFTFGGEAGECVKLIAHWELIPTPTPDAPAPGGETTITDEAVPLSGIFTRGDAIGYLWQQSGSPEWELSDFPDVPEDHEWAVAIGWAQDMGIALADQEGNFRPDDPVLRSVESLEASPEGELQEFLNRYAVYAGVELNAGELFIQLEGAWDDVIMGEEAQVIFDDFFARLEAALAQAA